VRGAARVREPTDTPPPQVDGIDVRRIETFEEHVLGIEIDA
jgi:hypothetical protein